jgi:hypothetical protein
MADRYWVGGTGTWNSSNTANWSATSGGAGGASVPGGSDDVFFDSASNATSYTVNFSFATLGFGSLNISGPASGNVTFPLALGTGFQASGNLTIAATGVIWNWGGTIQFFNSAIITTNGVALSNVTITFNDPGSLTLGSALTCSALNIFNGTFTTSASNYALTLNSDLGTYGGTWSLNASTVTANNIVGSGATINAGTSTLVLTSNSATVTTAASWYNVTLNSTSASSWNINSSVTISNTLTVFGPSSVGFSILNISTGHTIGRINTSGTAGNRRIKFTSGSISLTTTGSSCSDADFQSIAVSTNTLTGTRLGNLLGNSGITFSTPKTVYWNLSGVQLWGSNGWATSSGGSPNTDNFPLAQDTAVFDDAGSAGTVTLNSEWAVPSIDFSARTLAVTFATTGLTPTIYGNITLGSGVTLSGTGNLNFANTTTKTITSAGRTFTQPLTFGDSIFVNTSIQLGDALTCSNSITLAGGTLNTAGYAVQSTSFATSGTTNKTLTFGATTWTVTSGDWDASSSTGLTVNRGTSTINMTRASLKYFYAGTKTWGTINQGGSGTLQISDASGSPPRFANITNTVQPATVMFAAGRTYEFEAFNLSGTSGNLLTIVSNTSGATFTLSKVGGGVVACNFLSVKDSNATGSGANWYAGSNSTNAGNNTGWQFVSAPSGGMLFFF